MGGSGTRGYIFIHSRPGLRYICRCPISQLPVANEVRFERPSLSEKKEKKRMNAGREGGDGK